MKTNKFLKTKEERALWKEAYIAAIRATLSWHVGGDSSPSAMADDAVRQFRKRVE